MSSSVAIIFGNVISNKHSLWHIRGITWKCSKTKCQLFAVTKEIMLKCQEMAGTIFQKQILLLLIRIRIL